MPRIYNSCFKVINYIKMNSISKPHLVDLLRIFDKQRMFTPRIRYASVRSKPELLQDLAMHFTAIKTNDVIQFEPVRPIPGLPAIQYHLKRKKFYFDSQSVDVPTESRKRPLFQVVQGPIELTFP